MNSNTSAGDIEVILEWEKTTWQTDVADVVSCCLLLLLSHAVSQSEVSHDNSFSAGEEECKQLTSMYARDSYAVLLSIFVYMFVQNTKKDGFLEKKKYSWTAAPVLFPGAGKN